jgi:hypothetical protein
MNNNNTLIRGVLILIVLALIIGLWKAIVLVGFFKIILMSAIFFGAGWFYGKYSKKQD